MAEYYGSVLPSPSTSTESTKPRVLDIASSWISHLPEDWSPQNTDVLGIGMNEAELSKNRALARYLVIDLNKDPSAISKRLDEGEKYDAAICSVSIDYLAQPRELLADLTKVLKDDATVHLSFSNRCFPTKVSRHSPTLSAHDFQCRYSRSYNAGYTSRKANVAIWLRTISISQEPALTLPPNLDSCIRTLKL